MGTARFADRSWAWRSRLRWGSACGRLVQLRADPRPAPSRRSSRPSPRASSSSRSRSPIRGLRIKPPPLLALFSDGPTLGLPRLCTPGRAIRSPVLGVGPAPHLYGRRVLADRPKRAARRASRARVDVDRIRFATYVLSAASRPWAACSGELLRRRVAQHGRGIPASPRSPWWSSAAPRSPAETPTCRDFGAPPLPVPGRDDAQHLRVRRRPPLSRPGSSSSP